MKSLKDALNEDFHPDLGYAGNSVFLVKKQQHDGVMTASIEIAADIEQITSRKSDGIILSIERLPYEVIYHYNERNVNDAERSITALIGIEGKRLMYRDSFSGEAGA